jgi:septum formation protein
LSKAALAFIKSGVPAPLLFILASASPRRTELLREAGLPHTVAVAAVTDDEDPTTDPRQLVLHNARLKALAVARRFPFALALEPTPPSLWVTPP